ncbi:translation initiation factor IF-2 [Candidatus Parcubacteria bacterium]|nr:translation initiation factor IF-2 [Candidatus Parcubacteria bacterium]
MSRPPVIVITGHIDHGKSTLLDYIRKSNIVAGEAGGITQHLSAYEVAHKKEDGTLQKITFLDTPGHEAFSGMRERGVSAADIAILIVSAEDGVKAQTVEALKTIKSAGLPFIVAFNKIDKPGANVEKAKNELAEKEVYLEGYGGDVPYAEISAKTGQGVPELLDLIILVAELKELTTDPEQPAHGTVIESHLNSKRGVSATLIVKDGTLKRGDFLVIENVVSPIRIAEDFLGKPIIEATAGTPVFMAGLSAQPRVGAIFRTHENKKEAERAAESHQAEMKKPAPAAAPRPASTDAAPEEEVKLITVIPLTLKADTAGTLEALEKEIGKIKADGVILKLVQKGVGPVNEGEIKSTLGSKDGIILGFNVKVENKAKDLAEREGITIGLFNIIYKLTEWLAQETERRRPRVKVEEATGKAKILRFFSRQGDKQVIGGRVLEGKLLQGETVKIVRRDFEIGRGKIVELQSQKLKVKEVGEGKEFGLLIDSKMDIAEGDVLEAFMIVEK